MKANEEVSTSKTDLKKSQDRLKHAQGEIKKKQAELKKTESAYNKDKVKRNDSLKFQYQSIYCVRQGEAVQAIIVNNSFHTSECAVFLPQVLVDNLNTSTVNLETEMNRLGVDEATVESLGQEKRDLQNQIRGLSDNAENIYHRFPDLQFRYTRPSANFDDSQVKGLVAKV